MLFVNKYVLFNCYIMFEDKVYVGLAPKDSYNEIPWDKSGITNAGVIGSDVVNAKTMPYRNFQTNDMRFNEAEIYTNENQMDTIVVKLKNNFFGYPYLKLAVFH